MAGKKVRYQAIVYFPNTEVKGITNAIWGQGEVQESYKEAHLDLKYLVDEYKKTFGTHASNTEVRLVK